MSLNIRSLISLTLLCFVLQNCYKENVTLYRTQLIEFSLDSVNDVWSQTFESNDQYLLLALNCPSGPEKGLFPYTYLDLGKNEKGATVTVDLRFLAQEKTSALEVHVKCLSKHDGSLRESRSQIQMPLRVFTAEEAPQVIQGKEMVRISFGALTRIGEDLPESLKAPLIPTLFFFNDSQALHDFTTTPGAIPIMNRQPRTLNEVAGFRS